MALSSPKGRLVSLCLQGDTDLKDSVDARQERELGSQGSRTGEGCSRRTRGSGPVGGSDLVQNNRAL